MIDIIRLWKHVLPRKRKNALFLIFLMLLTSFTEIVSIGAVIPFLGVLASPETIFNEPSISSLINYFNFKEPSDLVIPFTVAFCISVVVAASMRLLLLYASIQLAFAIGKDLSVSIFNKTIYQNYSVHISRNSSEVISGIIRKTSTVSNGVVTPILTVITALSGAIPIFCAVSSRHS